MSQRGDLVRRMRDAALADPWVAGRHESLDGHKADVIDNGVPLRLILTFDMPERRWHLSITRAIPAGEGVPPVILPLDDEGLVARWASAFFAPHEALVVVERPTALAVGSVVEGEVTVGRILEGAVTAERVTVGELRAESITAGAVTLPTPTKAWHLHLYVDERGTPTPGPA